MTKSHLSSWGSDLDPDGNFEKESDDVAAERMTAEYRAAAREDQERVMLLKEERKRQETERLGRERQKRMEKDLLDKKMNEQRRQRERESGIVGPGRVDSAFSSRHDFTSCDSGPPGSEILGSRFKEESFLSFSYRMGREKLSLHESAPGSRWPQRLSAQRNCGFAGGLKRGLRKDAVNEAEKHGRMRRRGVAVPAGMQEAMRRSRKQADDKEGLTRVDREEEEDEDEEYYSAQEESEESENESSGETSADQITEDEEEQESFQLEILDNMEVEWHAKHV